MSDDRLDASKDDGGKVDADGTAAQIPRIAKKSYIHTTSIQLINWQIIFHYCLMRVFILTSCVVPCIQMRYDCVLLKRPRKDTKNRSAHDRSFQFQKT